MIEPRDAATRRRDTESLLATPAIDVWVASSSRDGTAHLVPLSLCWTGGLVVLATSPESVTAQNLMTSGGGRLAVGPTRDVVMIDAVLDRVVPVEHDDALHAAYVAQADWDPRRGGGAVFLVLRPVQVQAWREVNEIADRTLMRGGTWLA
ncbi:hypothetical protein ABIE44_003750 [Marmoricola sp. OAE513]|uniref:pyridoxamine 5'-phosphate oxidase family protein n=1 Tax=Marmoricola sp. OAE513 TaxID=2817894 RepID=UPI001AE18AFC